MRTKRFARHAGVLARWGLVGVTAMVPVASSAGAPPVVKAAAAPDSAPSVAPPIQSAKWINSKPLAKADLRGKVVLVEFWAFDCINCQRTVPAMKKLDATYDAKDVLIVGVHTPELKQERDPYNVEKAVTKLGLKYPIALDNDYRVWNAFKNRYWPALYVVDKHGVIRHTHIGELHEDSPGWEEVVRWIDELRKEPA